jgi:hypothetical protein
VLPLVLLTVAAPLGRGAAEEPPPAKPAVPVLKADAVYSAALKQVTSASPKLGSDVPTPVSSLKAGLPAVQRIAGRPILAMAERQGWFFYATSVVRDRDTDEPVAMISGYAIKRDGRRVVGWGVW